MQMRLKQTAEFSPINRRGGKRPGSGRPAGREDLIPRRGSIPETDRTKVLERVVKFQRRQIGELEKEIQLLRNELNFGQPFEGDSKALLTAVMRGEYFASPQQIYAARAVLDREYPPAMPVDPVTIVADGSIYMSAEYFEFEQRALRVLRKHPEALEDWIAEFREVERRALSEVHDDGG